MDRREFTAQFFAGLATFWGWVISLLSGWKKPEPEAVLEAGNCGAEIPEDVQVTFEGVEESLLDDELLLGKHVAMIVHADGSASVFASSEWPDQEIDHETVRRLCNVFPGMAPDELLRLTPYQVQLIDDAVFREKPPCGRLVASTDCPSLVEYWELHLVVMRRHGEIASLSVVNEGGS